MKTKYIAPVGATSISVDGESFEVRDGMLTVPAHVPHEVLLSHGYRLDGDPLLLAVDVAGNLQQDRVGELEKRAQELDTREQVLVSRGDAQDQLQGELNARATQLAQREQELIAAGTALAERAAQLDAREAALTAAPPPPPPAPTGKRK